MYLQLNKKSDHFMGSDLFYFRYRLSLPGGLPPSTISAERLNFCVRYGNRCDPFAIATGKTFEDCAFKTTQCKSFIDQALDLLVSVSFIHYCTSTSDLSIL